MPREYPSSYDDDPVDYEELQRDRERDGRSEINLAQDAENRYEKHMGF